jgi:hypothetical protein
MQTQASVVAMPGLVQQFCCGAVEPPLVQQQQQLLLQAFPPSQM